MDNRKSQWIEHAYQKKKCQLISFWPECIQFLWCHCLLKSSCWDRFELNLSIVHERQNHRYGTTNKNSKMLSLSKSNATIWNARMLLFIADVYQFIVHGRMCRAKVFLEGKRNESEKHFGDQAKTCYGLNSIVYCLALVFNVCCHLYVSILFMFTW